MSHNNIILLLYILVEFLYIKITLADYPIPACYDKDHEYIVCQSQRELDMNNELSNYKSSYKDYRTFHWVSPVANDLIPENAIPPSWKFDTIEITAENLNKIHVNSFANVDNYTKGITLNFWYDRPIKLRNYPDSEYDLYKALANIKHMERLYLNLEWDDKHDVPDEAFKVFPDGNLKHLYFNGRYNVSRIGKNIVNNIKSLEFIDFSGVTMVEKISKQAFNMNDCKDCTKVVVNLNNTMLSDESLEQGTFNMTGRYFDLNLNNNNFKAINEVNFKSYLDTNVKNTLSIKNNPLDCSSRVGYVWLLDKVTQYRNRVVANCANGESIWDHKWTCA